MAVRGIAAFLALLVVGLPSRTTAQGQAATPQIAVVVLSDPPGASLLASDDRTVIAKLPVTKTYAAPAQWTACASYPGFTVKWSNGVQVKIGRVDLCPEDGSRQQIVVSVPSTPAAVASTPPTVAQPTVVCRDGGIVYKPADGRCATGVPVSPLAPPAESQPYQATTISSSPRDRSGPTTLTVTMVDQQDRESTYQFVVPGTVNTYRAASATCYGQGNSALTATAVGNTVYGAIDTAARVNCAGSGTSTTTFTPAQTASFSVRGATLALRLPDQRTAVVNCNSKLNWTDWGQGPRRSCRIPAVKQFDVEFSGDKAKLIWRVGINGEKVVSETYDLIQILDPPR